ncbi:MAG TPA: endonuclease/exonuclease/phosphatase family protein [Anaerolineales bacterium]|nr:endonuclease/exonuclease/phosphatase family protein [Anaerolineales bacterium]
MRKKLGFLFSPGILVSGYTLAVFVWFALWLTVGDANWVLVLANRVAFFMFLPIPLLLMFSFLLHQRKPAALLIIPTSIFLWFYYPYLLPGIPTNMSDSSRILRVMTYNVLYSNTDSDAVANVILTHEPDLVALQEVVPAMMDALVELLQAEYPYYVAGTHLDFGETAVFSRYPIADSEVLDLQVDRRAVIVQLTIRGQEVTFVSVHLLAYNLWWTKLKDIPATIMERTRIQNHQTQIVLDQVSDQEGIVIVGCDCNSYETSSSYRILDRLLDNSSRNTEMLAALDFPTDAKRDLYPWHIDYVWYKGDLLPVGTYKITDSGGSDHLPVLSIFVIDSVEK